MSKPIKAGLDEPMLERSVEQRAGCPERERERERGRERTAEGRKGEGEGGKFDD